MVRMLFKLAATVAAVPVSAHYLPGVHAASLESAIIAGGILALLYLVLRPIARLVTGVFNWMTLGLLSIFIDAWLIMLCTHVLEGRFVVDHLAWAAACAVVVNAMRWVFGGFLRKRK